MKALKIQIEMNKVYAKASKTGSKSTYKRAYDLYTELNTQREIEGLPRLNLPALEQKILNI